MRTERLPNYYIAKHALQALRQNAAHDCNQLHVVVVEEGSKSKNGSKKQEVRAISNLA